MGGAIGGFARTAPARVRDPASIGLLAVLLLGMLQRIVPIVFVELGFEADWLYRSGRGLTVFGAVLVFVVRGRRERPLEPKRGGDDGPLPQDR